MKSGHKDLFLHCLEGMLQTQLGALTTGTGQLKIGNRLLDLQHSRFTSRQQMDLSTLVVGIQLQGCQSVRSICAFSKMSNKQVTTYHLLYTLHSGHLPFTLYTSQWPLTIHFIHFSVATYHSFYTFHSGHLPFMLYTSQWPLNMHFIHFSMASYNSHYTIPSGHLPFMLYTSQWPLNIHFIHF